MTILNKQKDYVNDKITIYPFDEIDKKLEKKVIQNNKNYDIEHYGKFQKLLYSEFNKNLLPYINEILDEYEYEGSVVYDEYIDRHSIFVMVTRVMELLKKTDYFKDFANYDFDKLVDSYTILRSDVETMLLSELFYLRRLAYAKSGKLKKDTQTTITKISVQEKDPIYTKGEFL